MRKVLVTSCFALVLVGAGSLVGCGDDTTGNPTGAIPLEDFGARRSEAACEQMFVCCTSGELDKVFALF